MNDQCEDIEKKHIIGLFIGTFGKVHSLPELIELLISSEIKNLPIDFNFIGDGEDILECKELVNKASNHNVKIYEGIPFEKVSAKLHQADFLIYSQIPDILTDTIGAKFYEYLSVAKPVLVIGNSIAMEIVKELGNGWWVNSLNLEKL